MRKLLGLGAVAAAMFAFSGSTRADVITSVSVNTSYQQPIDGGSNGYASGAPDNYTAGVQYVDDWNSYNSDITGGERSTSEITLSAAQNSMQTSTGATSPIGFSVSYVNADGTGSTGNNISGQHLFYQNTGAANDLVLNGGIQNGSVPITLGLTGLSAGDTYNVYVYASSLYFAVSNSIAISDGLQTYYLGATANSGLNVFTQATTTTPTTTAPAANYVEFTGITNLSALAITLTNADGAGDSPALTAFQIDDLGSSTPEPASLGIIGVASMLTLSRRRPATRM